MYERFVCTFVQKALYKYFSFPFLFLHSGSVGHSSTLHKRHLGRFSRFCRPTVVTDGQTGRPRYSVCNNRPHLRGTAMRPKTTREYRPTLFDRAQGSCVERRRRTNFMLNLNSLLYMCVSAMWINVPGLITLVTICSLAGMVVYAEYRRCDPLATDRIHATDQVLDSNVFRVILS